MDMFHPDYDHEGELVKSVQQAIWLNLMHEEILYRGEYHKITDVQFPGKGVEVIMQRNNEQAVVVRI